MAHSSHRYFHIIDENNQFKKKPFTKLSRTALTESLSMALPFVEGKRAAKRTETLIYPLKADQFDVDGVSALSSVVSGYGPGSIPWLLAQLAIAGFVVTSTSNDASVLSLKMKKAKDFAYLDTIAEQIGIGFKSDGIANFLHQPVRSGGDWDKESISKIITKRLGVNTKNPELLSFLTDAVFNAAGSWQPKDDDYLTPSQRADIICSALNKWSASALTPDGLLSLFKKSDSTTALSEQFDMQKSTLAHIGLPLNKTDTINALNADEYVIETGLLVGRLTNEALGLEPTYENASAVLTSAGAQYNGLSWLLNKGLSVLANASSADLAAHYNLDEALIQPIQKTARHIYQQSGSDLFKLNEYRASIGGGMSSFSGRFFDRLDEIATQVNAVIEKLNEIPSNSLPESLFNDDVERIYWNTGLTPATAKAFFNTISTEAHHLQDSLALTQTPKINATTIDNIHMGIGKLFDVAAVLNIIKNNIRNIDSDIKAAQAGKSDAATNELKVLRKKASVPEIYFLLSDRDTTPTLAILRLPKIRFSTESAQEKIQHASDNIVPACDLTYKLIAKLLGQSGTASLSLLAERFKEQLKEQDKRHYDIRGTQVDDHHLEVRARRHFLHYWFAFLRNLSPKSKELARQQLLDLSLIPDRKVLEQKQEQSRHVIRWRQICHLFMTEQKGALYRGLFSRSRHHEYTLDHDALLHIDLGSVLERTLQDLESVKDNSESPVALDVVQLLCRFLEMAARANKNTFTTTELFIDKWPLPLSLTSTLEQHDKSGQPLNERLISRLASLLAVSLRDASSLAYSDTQSDSATLKPVGPLKLVTYIPKTHLPDGTERFWRPHPRLLVDSHPAYSVLQSINPDVENGQPVQQIIGAINKTMLKNDPDGVKALLIELPHHWGISLKSALLQVPVENAKDVTVFQLEKGQIKLATQSTAQLYPLQASPEYTNKLDGLLSDKWSNSPGNLTFRWQYQKTDQGIKSLPKSIECHIVLMRNIPKRDEARDSFYDRLVGIDLGERGIGFTVRELTSNHEFIPVLTSIHGRVVSQIVEQGFIPVPAVKKLIKSVEKYRKRTQKSAHIRRHHVDYDKIRQATAGHVISAIKYLMSHYSALPVLERDVGNLASGSKQLSLVYDSVINNFCFQNVKTVDKVRENTWLGNYITHPNFELEEEKDGKVTRKAFNLFPGTSVNAAGTSQECSVCHVNPIKTVRDAPQNEFAIEANGQVVVNDELTLQLFSLKTIRNPDAVMEFLPKGIIKKDKLITHMRQAMRSAPDDARSKDTSVSRYHCLNAACTHNDPFNKLHADVNASDNIVRRKIQRLRVIKAS